jgi:hypothetical protein
LRDIIVNQYPSPRIHNQRPSMLFLQCLLVLIARFYCIIGRWHSQCKEDIKILVRCIRIKWEKPRKKLADLEVEDAMAVLSIPIFMACIKWTRECIKVCTCKPLLIGLRKKNNPLYQIVKIVALGNINLSSADDFFKPSIIKRCNYAI